MQTVSLGNKKNITNLMSPGSLHSMVNVKMLITTAADVIFIIIIIIIIIIIFLYFCIFSEKIMLDISCESSSGACVHSRKIRLGISYESSA